MSSENKNSSGGTDRGIGFFGLLAIVFIVLKLIGVINWSWLWVLAPIWIPLAIGLLIFIIAIVVIILKR